MTVDLPGASMDTDTHRRGAPIAPCWHRDLGRGVIVGMTDAIPSAWLDVTQVVIDRSALRKPTPVVDALHAAWAERRPVVVRLLIDPSEVRTPQTWDREPYRLNVRFLPLLDRLHFLLWANNYDARGGAPRWWWSDKASRLGAVVIPAGQGVDVRLPDGRCALIDGGPRQVVDRSDVAIVAAETVELGRLDVVPVTAGLRPVALAPDQMAAVAHDRGAARIIAPAGSGKTRVLTERLHVLHNRGVEREVTLACCFNVMARAQLEERCADIRPRARTLNSIGYEILRDAKGPVQVIDEARVRRILEPLLPPRDLRANTDPMRIYVDALGQVRHRLADPRVVEQKALGELEGLATAFPRYVAVLRHEGMVDFDGQVYEAVGALLADGALRRRWQLQCRHLLVDEFQDLTPVHLLMLRILNAQTLDTFGVGDDDQTLYGYAGASPVFLVDYGRFFPGAGQHALHVTYRCPAAVVTAASALLSANTVRVHKDTCPRTGAPDAADRLTIHKHGAEDATGLLLQTMTTWVRSGMTASDIAILARVNAQLLPAQVALLASGATVNSVLGAGILDRTGIRAALAYLRLATGSEEMPTPDITEIVRRPTRGLTRDAVERLRRRPTWTSASLSAMDLEGRDLRGMTKLRDDLALLRASARRGASTAGLLSAVRDRVGLGAAMANLDKSGVGDVSSHSDDLAALEQTASLHPEAATFEHWLRDLLSASSDPHGVMLSSVHRAKGLEWQAVVVLGVEDGIIPHRLSEDMEEERRILHVAITRAREYCVILHDARRPSPFLAEMRGYHPPKRAATAPQVARRRAPLSAPAPASKVVTTPVVGTQLRAAGDISGVVESISDQGVLLVGPRGRVMVRWGEMVSAGAVDGRLTRTLVSSAAAEAAGRAGRSRGSRHGSSRSRAGGRTVRS